MAQSHLPGDCLRPDGAARVQNHQFLHKPMGAGRIYPTLYITREQFESVPPPLAGFVVIRDLRDTLVSLYFSLKHSHV